MRGYCLITVGILLLLSNSNACHSSGAPPQLIAIEADQVKLRSVASVLIEEPKRKAETVTTAIGASCALKDVQFIDVSNGWAAGMRLLYKTSNAGESWKELDPNLPRDSYISSFFFTSPARGWLTVIHTDDKPQRGGYSSSIIITDDGGETWSEQSSFPKVRLRDLRFLNTEKGIAIGGRNTNHDPPHGEIFGVKTDDGGKTWKDFTQQLKPAIKGPFGFGHDEGRKIQWLSSNQVYLLTDDDRVLSSDDSGQTWKPIAHFVEDVHSNGAEKATTYHSMIFDTAGRLRLLGAQRGDEGFWSDFVVSVENTSWESYELSRVPLFDAVFLSANEILAGGMEVKQNARPSVGIVLYSKDNGKNWSPVYRTKESETLISLTKITDTDFYAVSDKGNFIKLSLK